MTGPLEHRANCKASAVDGRIVRVCAPDCPVAAREARGTVEAEVSPDAFGRYLTAMCAPVVSLLGLPGDAPAACPACGAPAGIECRSTCETNRAR